MKITITIETDATDAPKIRVAQSPPALAAPVPLPNIRNIRKPGSGPKFDPDFLRLVGDAVEPFTRQSLAAASALSVVDVTLRLNRMKKHGWVHSAHKGLWERTSRYPNAAMDWLGAK